MRRSIFALLAALLAPQAQDTIDPSLRAAVERFYATQEAEDAAAYLSLWSAAAERPATAGLKYIFDSGDDKFSELAILRVTQTGDRVVVRVSVTRDRTNTVTRRPDGSPMVFHTVMNAALTYVREGSEWKLVREGTPVDALADALLAAPTSGERERLLASEPELVGPLLVTAVSRQADSFAQRGNYPRAQGLYERALELATRIGHKKLQAETLQNLGNARYYQRDFAGMKEAYAQRLAIERETGNDEGIASALLGLGTAQYSQFEYSDAIGTFREALVIQERLNDESGAATTLISTGNVQYVGGDFAGAIADYRRSRLLYRKVLDTRGEARALEGLGRSFVALGDLAAALDAFAGVLDEGRRRNDAGLQGTALSNIGEVHFRLGNLDTARGLFDQSRLQFESVKDQPNVGRAWQAMAMTDLVFGRFAIAEQEYGRSSAACTLADNDCVARAIVGIAFAQSAQEHYDLAIASYRKAITAFTALKKREDAARAEIGLSQALRGIGDFAGALSAARHARDEGAAISRPDVVWRALVAQARSSRRLLNPVSALTAAKEAVAQVERMAQAALEGRAELPPADTAEVYALLAVLQAEAPDAASAFATVERGRVHALRTVLARNEREIARGMTTAEREDERQLAADLATVRAQLDHEKALPKPDAARIVRLQQRLAGAVEKRAAQRRDVFARLPDLRTWRGMVAAATTDEAAAVLTTEGEVLAEFLIDDENLLVVLLTRSADGIGCRAFVSPILRQTLAERIARALEPAALRGVVEWRLASADLMKAIPAGAWAAIAAAPRVIIAPDDVLWRVPFEALPVESGFLADRTVVMYAGSATVLVRVPSVAPPSNAVSVVAIGAPELLAAVRDRVQATSPGWTLRPTEAADAEIRTVGSLFEDPPATILSGTGATESALRAQAGAATMLHVAAPFRMNGASPLFSPILLTSEPDVADPAPDKDGVLETREVMNLDLHASVAVFSDGASGTMRGAAPSADTVRWAWRAAGVPSIVLPRWSVDDGAAVPLLHELYTRLKAGDAPADALQAARTAVRTGEDTRAPYFWAGWMVVGR